MPVIDLITVGDVVTIDRTGYAKGTTRKLKVTRKTAKYFFVRYNDVAEGKFNNDGVLMPRDKYTTTYVTHINDTPVADLLKEPKEA